MNISATPHTHGTEIPALPTPGTSAGGGGSRPSSAHPSSRPNYGRLSGISGEAFDAIWMRFDIPAARIAERLNVSRQAVSALARRRGLPKRPDGPCGKIDTERFTRMWNAGVRRDEIAMVFGFKSGTSARQWARRLGLPARDRTGAAPGINGWDGTITLEQFQEHELGRLMAAAAKGDEHV